MSTALVWIALLAATNPPRRLAELDPRPRPAIAAAGTAIAAVALVAAVAVAEPLVEWLAVSDATFRIGAGLVLGLRALVDALRRPRAEPEALAGWGEAAVPVAFPVLLRPETTLIAMAAGLDVGVGAAIAAVAGVSVTTAVVLVAWPGRALLRPCGVVVNAVAVVVAVAVIVGGVLDL